MKPEAVLFDFNGVLVDDEPVHYRAAVEVLGPRGFELTEADYYTRYLGLPDHRFLRHLYEDRGRTLEPGELGRLLEEKEAAYARRLPEVRLVPGADEALSDLAGRVPVAIVSGAIRAEIEAVLGKFGLRKYVSALVAAEDVPHGKPDPDGYLLGLERLGRPTPGRCLAIEDAPAGIRAARAAGLDCWALTTGRPAAELSGASRVLPSLEGVVYDALELVSPRLVVAGVLGGPRGVLLCRRPEGGWEFPGGKVEPGETPPEALARELDEELALKVRVGEELGRSRWGKLELRFFEVLALTSSPPSLHYYPEIAWASWAEVEGYDLLEADRLFVTQRNREATLGGARLS